MDPNETLKVMRDETAEPEDRIEAAEALRSWLNSGGFVPSPLGVSFGGNTAARFYAIGLCDRVVAEMSKAVTA